MVTWTRDGGDISSVDDSHLYTPSQLVVPNGGKYRSGDYTNILTVSGSLPGMYGVSVTNVRTTTPVTAGPITVRGNIHPIYSGIRLLHIVMCLKSWLMHACTSAESAHSSFSPSGAQHLKTIQLSWSLVDSSFTVRSYVVKYTVCDIRSGQCDATVSIPINDITDTNYILDNVNIWATYNFTVLAYFNSMGMTHTLPLTSGVHTVTTQGMFM